MAVNIDCFMLIKLLYCIKKGEDLSKVQPCRPFQYQIKQFCNVLLAK